MKFYLPVIIFSIITIYLPSLVAQLKVRTHTNKLGISLLLWAIPTLFLIVFFLFRLDFLHTHHQSFLWFVWLFLFLFLPANLLALLEVLDTLFTRIFKKKLRLRSIIGYPLVLLISVGLFVGAVNRYDIDVHHVEISMNQLPKAFDGLKIVQISDVHLGNLSNANDYLETVATKINAEKPDLIVLTGDLVNLTADEGSQLHNPFGNLEATFGKFAVLGNHDYGDYSVWKTPQDKIDNFNHVKTLYKDLGFNLLLDEHRVITKDSSHIGIIGVENCGKKPFPCYGNLDKALEQLPTSCNILLSHDPTHWRAEALQHPEITLMLAGHTHGAQLGIDSYGLKYSPSQWIFDEWDGLYEENNQFLFINRGLGYVGIPFRLGMRPEISVITLKVK